MISVYMFMLHLTVAFIIYIIIKYAWKYFNWERKNWIYF